jgi:hypothetical protein
MSSLPPQSTAATVDNAAISAVGSISTASTMDNDCYHCRQQLPSPLPQSQQSQPPEASSHYLLLTVAMAVIVDGSGSR